MLHLLGWCITLYAPIIVVCVNLNIDGTIDLGPNWNYEYAVKSVNNDDYTNGEAMVPGHLKLKKHKTKTKATNASAVDDFEHVTRYKLIRSKGIFEKPRQVKDDNQINDFTYHVYKQSLKVFDEIKKKVDPSLERKVDYLSRSYDKKFRTFVNETLHQKIKTRLGPQRVVLNVIDTSNQLLKRLVNYFIGDINKEGVLRNNMAAANVFQKEVDREAELEMKHACSKFGICKVSNGFSQFLIDVFTIIMQSDDHKIKQAGDAITEVWKNTDFSNVMDASTKKKFKKKISEIERYDANMLKASFWIGKNVLALKNRPIDVMVTGSDHINKTVALLEVIDEMDKQLPSNDENNLEWNDIKNSLTDWSEGKRHDILEIMQGLVSFVKKKGFDNLTGKSARNFREKLTVLMS